MERLKPILAGALGVLVLLFIVDSVVYPQWIKPLLTIDDRIAEKNERYEELKAVETEVKQWAKKYQALAGRAGSFDLGKVETDLRDRLNKLIEKHKLVDASTVPSRPKRDQKTDLTFLTVTVKGQGTLQAAIEFLRDASELPQLARVTNPAIYPASRSRKERGPAKMNIRVPIEILIPPQHEKVGKIKPQDLDQPESFVRHEERDYSSLWAGTPFTPEPDYDPLKVDAGRDIKLRSPQRRKSNLRARVTGGDKQYTCKWEPADGLEKADDCRTELDVSEPYDRTYVVTATDGQGWTATDSLRVKVEPKRVVPPPPGPDREDPSPPTPPKPQPWKYAKNMQLVMVLGTRSGSERIWEAMIDNRRTHQTEYYTKGQEFDGGELLAMHPTGVLARRSDDFFIYPIGHWLNEAVNVVNNAADEYPELKAVAHKIKDEEEKKAAEEAAREAAEAERKAAEAAQKSDKTKAPSTPARTGQGAPRNPGSAEAPSSAKQPDTTVRDPKSPVPGRPGTARTGAPSGRPGVRNTPQAPAESPDAKRDGPTKRTGKFTPQPGTKKPAITRTHRPGRTDRKVKKPNTRRAPGSSRRGKFQPRNLGKTPKPEPDPGRKPGASAEGEGVKEVKDEATADKKDEGKKEDGKKEEKEQGKGQTENKDDGKDKGKDAKDE
ncbi:MAG: hypothetical protein PVI86_00290 [Phycisphaerae bacterium]|jgi:hypothetical protein